MNTEKNQKGGLGQDGCRNCGQTGHFARECQNDAASSNNVPISSNEFGETSGPSRTSNIKRSDVTQMLHVPAEERRYHEGQEHQFGEKSQEQQDCNEIMQKTDTSIELWQNKDHSLTIVVTGKRQNVEEARKLIVQQLQTQARKEIRVPKDHHRVLIGREGERLRQLEKETDCRIMIPNRDNASEVIKIFGPREGIEKAIHHIQLIFDEQMTQVALTIPKIYYPWIKGPFNETVDRLQSETGARVIIPPPSANIEVVVVTGEKEPVQKAAAFIKQIHEEKQRNTRTARIEVVRSQHRFVIGPQRSGLAEILRETDVSVEVPPEDAESDTITLRGEPDKLGQALAIVFAKADSVITTEISCPSWLRKFVIGTRGANIRDLIPDPQKLQLNFEDEIMILQGAPEEVKRVKEALTALVQQKQAEMASEILHINPSHHRHIIGENGANISRIKNDVQISIPSASDENSDEIVITGFKDKANECKEDIQHLVSKFAFTQKVTLDCRIHSRLIGQQGKNIRKMMDDYKVEIRFPRHADPNPNLVIVCGPNEGSVYACVEYLRDKEEEFMQEAKRFEVMVQVPPKLHPKLIGPKGRNINRLSEKYDVQISIPSASDENLDEVVITGFENKANECKEDIQRLVSKFAFTQEITLDCRIHNRLIGQRGKNVRKLMDDYKVEIRFPRHADPNPNLVTVCGPNEGSVYACVDYLRDKEEEFMQAAIRATVRETW